MARQININDKVQGRLIITPPVNGILRVQREYRLVGDDDLLNQIPLQVLDRNVELATLPQGMIDALVAMDAWTGAEIDEDEELT